MITSRDRYIVLSIIARDVFAIPVLTVAYELAFSIGGRVIDTFRTSLTPQMVEALTCAQDWMRTCSSLSVEENLLELQILKESGFPVYLILLFTFIVD